MLYVTRPNRGLPKIGFTSELLIIRSEVLLPAANSSGCEGRNMENTVPHLPGTMLLFTRIEPLCLSTIFLQAQRPSPAPTSLLVVTNGSNRLDRTFAGIPQPESATTSLTP